MLLVFGLCTVQAGEIVINNAMSSKAAALEQETALEKNTVNTRIDLTRWATYCSVRGTPVTTLYRQFQGQVTFFG
jgi:hypothetical protein